MDEPGQIMENITWKLVPRLLVTSMAASVETLKGLICFLIMFYFTQPALSCFILNSPVFVLQVTWVNKGWMQFVLKISTSLFVSSSLQTCSGAIKAQIS